MTARALNQTEMSALLGVLRRIAEARVADPDTVEDLVQEAATRLIEARERLVPSVLTSYGVVTLRNLILSLERQAQIERRHKHRLLELREPERPDEVALREEDREAMATAIDRLSARDRDALIAHEVAGASLATLAKQMESTPGAMATRLARVRARARLEYLLAVRRVQLPTPRCHAVLMALSSGDKRRQTATDASAHLLDCPTCASLSAPLLRRRRPLSVLLPLPFAGKDILRFLRAPKGQALAIGAGGAGAVMIALILNNSPPHAEGSFFIQGRRVLARAVATDEDYAGERVVAREVRVLSVPSDEGFWVGGGHDDRVWVQLQASGESRIKVKAGRGIGFTGRVLSHGDDFADRMRLQRGEGRSTLLQQDQHIVVLARDVRRRAE